MHCTRVLRDGFRSNTIGFLGLGAMGNHMFANLVAKSPSPSSRFVVYDVNPAAVSRVVERHKTENPHVPISVATGPDDVARKASKIITMIPTSQHVKGAYLGQNSIMEGLKSLDKSSIKDTLCLDESTIEQSVSIEVASQIRELGAEMVDAPVSGGVVGAEKGTLAIFVGGSKEAYERAVPVLEPMSQMTVHCGPLGAGLAAKIANNLMLGISMLGLSEAMLLGRNLGIEPQIMANIINRSTGRCWSSEVNNPVPSVSIPGHSPPAHRDYQGGFVTKLAHKDLGLAVEAAKASNTPLHLGELTESLYRPLAKDKVWGNQDFSVIYKYLSVGEKL